MSEAKAKWLCDEHFQYEPNWSSEEKKKEKADNCTAINGLGWIDSHFSYKVRVEMEIVDKLKPL